MHRIAARLLFVFAASGLSALDFWDDKAPGPLADELVAAMTTPELASQALMLAFPDPVPDQNILDWIGARSLGGVKFFGWNAGTPVQVAEASAALQARSQKTRFRIPLLVATDQEGGWVRHIKGATTTTAGNLSLGSSGLPSDAYQTARLIGAELREMGVNMNFAPSVDLYTNAANTVIGPRSFGRDPVEAGVLGMAFFRGLQSRGVIATAKHFPGHGDTADDSHGILPIIHVDKATLEKRELVPYKMLIAEGLGAVMSAHIAYPEVAGNGLPASLSPELIDGLLRRDLGYQGVVITDDLYMEGARPNGWTIAQAAERALEAGNDLMLVSKPDWAQMGAWQALVSRADRDPVFLERLRTSVKRVLLLKLHALKGPGAVPLAPRGQDLAIPAAGADDLVLGTTARGATLLASASLPWKTADGAPLVVTPYEGAYRAIAQRYPGATQLSYSYEFFNSDPAVAQQIAVRVAAARRTVFVLATPGGLDYLKALEPWKDKIAVVSLLSPVYLKDLPWVRDAVAVFGTNAAAFDVAAAVLAGEIQASGRLPLRFGAFPGEPAKP
jgi:beta-N-acetylhexosaminidase